MSKPNALKGCLESLVSLEKTTRQPSKPSCGTSPLISNFEKWSGKPRKLYSRDAQYAKKLCLPSGLSSNIFAQLLTSPMRLDRITRVRAPKELLVQVKLRKADIEASVDRSKPFELRPTIRMERELPTSYVSNSSALVHKRSSSDMKWLPSSANNSNIRQINQADFVTQPEWYLQDYTKELLGSLRKALSSALIHVEQEPRKSHGDIVLVCNPRLPAISVRKSKKPSVVLATTLLNLDPVKDPEVEKLVNNREIELSFSEHQSLCLLIYRLLAFQADCTK
ncbi:LAQU0S10e04126g1_1 [Lachancea quebecensis]|uniref:Required for respiratory growth protein 8, mitochondrial n=1 Tax=Lachancea quebecensis TaxID=1654605 RepID=A0A0P1KUR0_9SACH|nr:LAQU0S10e04126g1_1 [Lachancea quebecensis]